MEQNTRPRKKRRVDPDHVYSTNPFTVRENQRKANLSQSQLVYENAKKADKEAISRLTKDLKGREDFQKLPPEKQEQILEDEKNTLIQKRSVFLVVIW